MYDKSTILLLGLIFHFQVDFRKLALGFIFTWT